MTCQPIVIPMTPARVLSPNARTHWATKARAVSRYREAARLSTAATIDVDERNALHGSTSIGYTVRVAWERGRRGSLDEDNVLASCKAALDGVADALGIDDRRFHVRGVEIDRQSRAGVTVITLTREDLPA